MKYIVSISGGLGSAEALKRAIEKFGKENVIALFADVKGTGDHAWLGMPTISKLLHERFGGETRDTYRFIWQLSHHFDIPIERLETSESIWDVFARKKALRLVIGSIFFCPASEELKRKMVAKWIQENLAGQEWIMVLGMSWEEPHRIVSSQKYWTKTMGYEVSVISLNAEKPYASNESTALYFMKAQENDPDDIVQVPSAYLEEFEHNNCGGGCVQAGQTHYANLYFKRPATYHYWAWMENRLGHYIGEHYTILKRTENGVAYRISLLDFLEKIKAGDYPKFEGQSCACFGNIYQLEHAVNVQLEAPKQIGMFPAEAA